MPTHRELLQQTSTGGCVIASSAMADQAATGPDANANTPQEIARVGRKSLPRIKSAIRREDTTLRLGGMGDNFHMSWAADGRQFVAVCDGLEWSDDPKVFYNSRLYTIAGGPHDAVFQDVAGYPDLTGVLRSQDVMRYYSFGTLALDGYIYQFLSSPNHQFLHTDMSPWPGASFIGAKLIYSPDNGRSWRNQDGSIPVVWEQWQHRSRENMVFFEESQNAFSLLSVLQMGQNYAANEDGYVYVYAPNGSTDGTMNQLVMFRVPKARILDRGAYEYFAGLQSDGSAGWTSDIDARAVVHAFPGGWVNKSEHPWAWMPSVTYNIPLGVYMMASWGTGCTPDGVWFGKPSYLGLWIANTPWGPWTQILEETAWTPRNDLGARAFAPQISSKWIAADGKSFWIVWADFQRKASQEDGDQLDNDAKRIGTSNEDTVRYFRKLARVMPYYSFNTQRVDLVLE